MWTLTTHYNDWNALEKAFDWVKDMKDVPQDPIFHAEGNVAIHTAMVIKELQRLEEFQLCSKQEQEIVLAAALFHDVEKRSTTKLEDGRLRSPNHAKKGAQTARTWLYRNTDAPFEIREQIVQLVRYHGFPLWFLEREAYKKEVIKISLQLNTKLLYLLAKADLLGRICEDQEHFLEQIALFKMCCIDLDCFGKAKAFVHPDAQFHYANYSDVHETYIPYNNTKSNVFLMVALPGSGKDYYIKNSLKELKVISLDDMRRAKGIKPLDKKGNGRIIQEAKTLAKQYLAKGIDFVWNATNISQDMRKQLISLFTDYKARVYIVYKEVPYQQLLQQNHNRSYPIPNKALERMIDKWEVPAAFEAHHVDYIIGN